MFVVYKTKKTDNMTTFNELNENAKKYITDNREEIIYIIDKHIEEGYAKSTKKQLMTDFLSYVKFAFEIGLEDEEPINVIEKECNDQLNMMILEDDTFDVGAFNEKVMKERRELYRTMN